MIASIVEKLKGDSMQNISTIKNVISPIAKEYGLKKVFLFGSYAKGTATEESDIDLLIEIGRKMSLLGLSGFRQDIGQVLNLPIDVVTTNALDETFRNSIKGSEVLLYEEQR